MDRGQCPLTPSSIPAELGLLRAQVLPELHNLGLGQVGSGAGGTRAPRECTFACLPTPAGAQVEGIGGAPVRVVVGNEGSLLEQHHEINIS